jgi:putative transposase
MPEHIHLLVYPEDEHYEMSSILRLLKERFARWVVARWQEHDSYMLERIKIQRGNRIVHRFWQEGGDYDRNLCDWDKIRRAVDYIEWNPVRRGLVTDPLDWKWSSAQARVGYADVPLRVDEIDMDRVEKV